MASSSSGCANPAWHSAQASPPAYHALYPPSFYYPAYPAHHDHDPRLIAILQHGALLEFDNFKLVESKYTGKSLQRWAASFADTFGHVDGVEAALEMMMMRNEGIEGDAARAFIATLVNALRDAQSAQPAARTPLRQLDRRDLGFDLR